MIKSQQIIVIIEGAHYYTILLEGSLPVQGDVLIEKSALNKAKVVR